MKELSVGNLLYSVGYDEVRDLFADYGTVYTVKLIAERVPGHPHAFAFVEMEDSAADAAIRSLDGAEFLGRALRVEEARPEMALNRQVA
jgi:RNA recognition motif-containing protein